MNQGCTHLFGNNSYLFPLAQLKLSAREAYSDLEHIWFDYCTVKY